MGILAKNMVQPYIMPMGVLQTPWTSVSLSHFTTFTSPMLVNCSLYKTALTQGGDTVLNARLTVMVRVRVPSLGMHIGEENGIIRCHSNVYYTLWHETGLQNFKTNWTLGRLNKSSMETCFSSSSSFFFPFNIWVHGHRGFPLHRQRVEFFPSIKLPNGDVD